MEINGNHICLYIQFGGTLYFSHAGREHGPTILCVRAAMPPSSSLLLLLHHFILPQLEVECANTPPPLPSLTDWTFYSFEHKPDVPLSHYAGVSLAP